MNQAIKRLSPLRVAICASILAGCSGEPSNADVKLLVEREVKPALEAQVRALSSMAGMFGSSASSEAKAELKEVKKVGCEAKGDSAYLCDVELVMLVGDQSKSQIMQLRFVKASKGWVLAK